MLLFYLTDTNLSTDSIERSDIHEVRTQAVCSSTSVLEDSDKLKNFLSSHRYSGEVFNDDSVIKQKSRIFRAVHVAIEKLVEERGLYPRYPDKVKLSEALGKLFNQQPSDFFDKKTKNGYITSSLRKYRQKFLPISKSLHIPDDTMADLEAQFAGL